MAKTNARFEARIKQAAPFARPILTHLRAVMHATLPEVEEDLKWGHPTFLYKGIFASVAAFKQHCTFGFWKHDLLVEQLSAADQKAMAGCGRITSVADLPNEKTLARIIKAAAKLNDDGVKPVRAKPRPVKDRVVEVPPDLRAALHRDAKARAAFDAFSYSHKTE
ncbi:MAG: DUF1801 domain-containing protein [Planctomycetota bacterium]